MSVLPEIPPPVTVVVVDDSATQRRFVRAAIEDDPRLVVVGEAGNGRDAVSLVEQLAPAAVLMDLHLPVMNGIEAIERIMARRPTPIVVYSSFVDGADRDNAASALAAGAIEVFAKPGAHEDIRLETHAQALRDRLRVAGRARVITHPRSRLGQASATLTTRRLRSSVASDGPGLDEESTPSSVAALVDARRERTLEVLAIGASTGGPHALAALLADLPAQTDVAVVVVQHMADGFMEGLAGWLDTVCPLPVGVAVSGRRLSPGSVTLAPSGANLVVYDGLRVTAQPPAPGQYHVPGIDVTFTSVAQCYGPAAAGVLLTGMGRDGAIGLKQIRERGGLTIGQDEATSAVYGMPAAAMAIDAVDLQLALPDITAAVSRLLDPARDGAVQVAP